MRRLIIFAALLLAACSSPGDVRRDSWTAVGFDSWVKDVVTPEGARCVVFDGSFAGGITCDWTPG